ncbi:tyrosine-type recombinase/integrase [Neisseria flavescens]|uniref:tyrosine-type recombinase/integrase n=1 Tax=Neisseria flavescens TaxID=484 RepID=UPI0024B15743|nr:tyrosine-type recombinase/integrase [Neisseria flavescens]
MWHDLRHTWANWLVQRGVPLRVLQEVCGWKTLRMVQRYAHLAPEHLHQHAQVLHEFVTFDTNGAS